MTETTEMLEKKYDSKEIQRYCNFYNLSPFAVLDHLEEELKEEHTNTNNTITNVQGEEKYPTTIKFLKEKMRNERIQLYQARAFFVEDCKKYHLQESYKGLKAGIWRA